MGTKTLQADPDLILQLQQGDRKAFESDNPIYRAENVSLPYSVQGNGRQPERDAESWLGIGS
jgi:hypothetical protein